MLGEIRIEATESVKVGDGRNDEDVLDSRGRCVDCLCRLALSFFGVDAVARDECTF